MVDTSGRFTVPSGLERSGAWSRAHPLVVDSALAAVLAAGLAPWTLAILVDGDSEPAVSGAIAARWPWTGIVILAVVAGHAAFAVRRTRPLTSFAVVGVAVGVQVLTSVWWLLPSTLLFLPSLYSYCAYGRRPAPIVAVLVAAGGAVSVTFAGVTVAGRAAEHVDPLFHAAVRLLPFLLTAWALGMWRRVRSAYIETLRERAVRAEAEREERAGRAVAEERARIARETHDIVAHALSAVISQSQGGRYAARSDPEQALEALTTIAETSKQALADMRGLLAVLRPDRPAGEDVVPQPTLGEVPDLLARVREAGLSIDYVEEGTRSSLSPAAELAAFRLIQEALSNTLKHAGSRARVTVRLDWSTRGLDVLVHDDGAGSAQAEGGHGLIGMRERTEAVGGSVTIDRPRSGGFRVRAHLPQQAPREVTR